MQKKHKCPKCITESLPDVWYGKYPPSCGNCGYSPRVYREVKKCNVDYIR